MPVRLTFKEFEEKANIEHNNIYSYPGKVYTNNRTKIPIKCEKHGIFEQTPNSHLNGNGCPKCYMERVGSTMKLGLNNFIDRSNRIHNQYYNYDEVIYINNATNVIIKCNLHGKFQQTPSTHLSGGGCPECNKEKLRLKFSSNIDKFIQKAKEIHGDVYNYDDFVYVNTHKKGIINCIKHGKFLQTASKHLSGQGCPICKSSKGEVLIRSILVKNKINFEMQYVIPGAVQRFRYDFYLPDYNLFIEFHGVQHFKSIDFFGGTEGLKETKRRDSMKLSLSNLANIPIIYLDYIHLKKLSKQQFEELLLRLLIRGKGYARK